MSIYKSQTFIMWYIYIFLDIREESAFRNSPITRQSNPLNATVTVIFTHGLHSVSACRLATAVASMFDREKL